MIEKKTDSDASDDGAYEEVVDFTYNANGDLALARYDTAPAGGNVDGSADRTETFVYDAESIWSDILLRTEVDSDANGSMDRVVHYDENGGAERIEDIVYGTNAGGDSTLAIKYATIKYLFGGQRGSEGLRGGQIAVEGGLVSDANGAIQYEREKVTTFGADGTTVASVVETEYSVSGGYRSGSRTLAFTRTDSDGDGVVDSVAAGDGQPVAHARASVEFDAANGLSYETVTIDSTVQQIWFPAVGEYVYELTAAIGAAWRNVDTIALYNKDDTDGDFAGAEGSSGDVILTLTDDFIDALMAGRGADDHVMIWGDEGDTLQMNLSRYEVAIIQYDETHQWFEILDIDGTPQTVMSAPDEDGETVSGPGRYPKQFDPLLAIDSDIAIVDIPLV